MNISQWLLCCSLCLVLLSSIPIKWTGFTKNNHLYFVHSHRECTQYGDYFYKNLPLFAQFWKGADSYSTSAATANPKCHLKSHVHNPAIRAFVLLTTLNYESFHRALIISTKVFRFIFLSEFNGELWNNTCVKMFIQLDFNKEYWPIVPYSPPNKEMTLALSTFTSTSKVLFKPDLILRNVIQLTIQWSFS